MARSAYPLVEMELASSGLKFGVKGPAAMAASLTTPLGPDGRPPPLEPHATPSSNMPAIATPALLPVNIYPLLARRVAARDARHDAVASDAAGPVPVAWRACPRSNTWTCPWPIVVIATH